MSWFQEALRQSISVMAQCNSADTGIDAEFVVAAAQIL